MCSSQRPLSADSVLFVTDAVRTNWRLKSIGRSHLQTNSSIDIRAILSTLYACSLLTLGTQCRMKTAKQFQLYCTQNVYVGGRWPISTKPSKDMFICAMQMRENIKCVILVNRWQRHTQPHIHLIQKKLKRRKFILIFIYFFFKLSSLVYLFKDTFNTF